MNVGIAPDGLQAIHSLIFTEEAKLFTAELYMKFADDINQVM